MVPDLTSTVFPDELLEGMSIEAFMVSPGNREIGVAILSGEDAGMHVLRLYHMVKDEDENFHPTHELEAFSFRSKKSLKKFMKQLPNLSALELLIIMNPQPAISH